MLKKTLKREKRLISHCNHYNFDNIHRFRFNAFHFWQQTSLSMFCQQIGKKWCNLSYWFEWIVYNLITDTLSSPYGIIIDMFEADISQGVGIQQNFYNLDKVKTFSEVFKLNFNDQKWKEIWNCLKLFVGFLTVVVKTHFLTKKIEFHKLLLLLFIVIF